MTKTRKLNQKKTFEKPTLHKSIYILVETNKHSVTDVTER